MSTRSESSLQWLLQPRPMWCFELAASDETRNKQIRALKTHRPDLSEELAAMSLHLPTAQVPRPNPRRRLEGAAHLNKQLRAVEAPRSMDFARTDNDVGNGNNRDCSSIKKQPQGLHSLMLKVGDALQPQGDTCNDDTPIERAINVATSLPFLTMGTNMLRKRKTAEGRSHAISLILVGLTASSYHLSRGALRRVMRKLDYWVIAYSSMQMMKALYPNNKLVARTANASLLAVPFRPFAVSSVGVGVMQAEFCRQAMKYASVRPHLHMHGAAATAGAAAFALEDPMREKGIGFVHSAWHCLALLAVSTMGSLIDHKEGLLLSTHKRPKTLRSTHDSAQSLSERI